MKSERYLRDVLCLSVALTGMPSCTPSPEDLEQQYQEALKDAQTATPDEISRSLTAVVPWNDKLVWEGDPNVSRVAVVTWTSYTGYDSQVGQTITASRDIWVTMVPEIRNWVRRHHILPRNLTLRLEELLGVPPHSGKIRFVEFWVDPNTLFRPSPDPEITDREAELDFPVSAQFVTVSQSYTDWFNALEAISYEPNGYPWTRLGYTYDWGNPFTNEGLSEFVIPQFATITVKSVASNEDYCRWW